MGIYLLFEMQHMRVSSYVERSFKMQESVPHTSKKLKRGVLKAEELVFELLCAQPYYAR